MTGSPQKKQVHHACHEVMSHDLWILAAMTAQAMDIVLIIKQIEVKLMFGHDRSRGGAAGEMS